MSAHDQLVFVSWLTTLAVIGTAAFIGWLGACAGIAIYHDVQRWMKRRRRRKSVIPGRPAADARIYSIKDYRR
jgi:hypothetical protein